MSEKENQVGCCGAKRKRQEKQSTTDVSGRHEQKMENEKAFDPKSGKGNLGSEEEQEKFRRIAENAVSVLPLSPQEQKQAIQGLQIEMMMRERWKKLLRFHKATRAAKTSQQAAPSAIEIMLAGEKGLETQGGAAPQSEREPDPIESLEQKRQSWIEQSSSKKNDEDNSQPKSISLSDEGAHDMAAHTFDNLMKGLVQIAMEQKAKSKSQETKKKEGESPMTHAEMIAMSKGNQKGWKQLVVSNAIASVGLCKPTPDDVKEAQRTAAMVKAFKTAGGGGRVQFVQEVEVVTAPVGRDFSKSEKYMRSQDTLKTAKPIK